MKLKVSDFYESIGTVFINTKDIIETQQSYNEDDKASDSEFVVLREGTYIIVDSDSHGYNLYNISKNKNVFFEIGWVDENKEFQTVYTPPIETLELMIDSMSKRIIQLTSDGWVLDNENKYFNLSPEIEKLTILTTTYNAIKLMKTANDS